MNDFLQVGRPLRGSCCAVVAELGAAVREVVAVGVAVPSVGVLKP
jgi:hypothetical protein